MDHSETTDGPRRLLIVDDSEVILKLLELQLSRMGYKVVTAASGDAAIKWCHENGQPDLLLTDVCMPDIDGPALYQKLNLRFPGIAVLFMTGLPVDRLDSLTAPILHKPFRLSQLTSRLADLLASNRTGSLTG